MMTKRVFLVTIISMIASACSVLQPGSAPAPAIDSQATIDAIVHNASTQTAAAQPSPTVVSVTETGTAVVASSPTPGVTIEASAVPPSSTPLPNLTTTPATATSGPAGSNVTATATQAVALPGTRTLTPTLGILTYGTLPPAVPWAKITVINVSRAQAYISLQNYPPVKDEAFLEYPVERQVKLRAPLGYYLYVVWVGGRKIVGEFRLHNNDDLTITIYKDKVEIIV